MLFCIMANYTPQAINGLMENPETSRLSAVQSLLEAAGGRVVSLYSTAAEGPGAMLIFDVPDAQTAPAVGAVIAASGSVQNLRLMRLMTPEEVPAVRRKAAQLRAAYKPAGK
ncbi:GYD domain-containing protein [Falsiroseomonas oryziterrae]|uniref:GYD domain-containing protein n=1 Tax=Falsiroseomonas oryziterrae TaxID=2911368 RepID=UPI001F366AC4|nr:GYD domain-containing protein [Roseomonas sp. NPKOSM-4]